MDKRYIVPKNIEVMEERHNSELEEKFREFSKIEANIYNKYINRMSSKADKLLDGKISSDCGMIDVFMKKRNVLARILLKNGDPTVIKCFETDNEDLWGYIVNVKYYSNPKIILIKEMLISDSVNYEHLSLGNEFYKEIDNLWNDDSFITLKNELSSAKEYNR